MPDDRGLDRCEFQADVELYRSGVGGPFDDAQFVVVDVETTGIRPTEDRIIEVAAIAITGTGVETDRWSTLVKPDDWQLSGRLEAVADAPAFDAIAGDLCDRLSGAVVVGHNVRFDLRMIDAELGRVGVGLPELVFIDTHSAATTLNIDTPNRSLAVLCEALGVPMDQWHTAEGDAHATAALLVKLLERAAGWGRTQLSDLCGTWYGTNANWPTLSRTGMSLRRDPATFPPGGRQPGHAATFKPSWRRYGAGEKPATSGSGFSYTIDLADYADVITASTIKAVRELIEEAAPGADWPEWWASDWVELADYIAAGGDDADEAALVLGNAILAHDDEQQANTPAGAARADWYAGDFQADSGIGRLELIIGALDPADIDDSHIMLEATTLLADLYTRHGGRHEDVINAYERGLEIASTLGQSPGTTDSDDNFDHDHTDFLTRDHVEAWWAYTHKRREVQELIELHNRITTLPGKLARPARPTALAAQSVRSYVAAGELVVARDLYDQLVGIAVAQDSELASACERLANAFAVEGRTNEAIALCEDAWAAGLADQNVANRHSLILERLGRYGHAVDVAERALALSESAQNEALEKRVIRCKRRLTDK